VCVVRFSKLELFGLGLNFLLGVLNFDGSREEFEEGKREKGCLSLLVQDLRRVGSRARVGLIQTSTRVEVGGHGRRVALMKVGVITRVQ
jgi:hypothetical protein